MQPGGILAGQFVFFDRRPENQGWPKMLKAIALGLAAGIVLAGPALAQPLRLPATDAGPPVLLVKHDKDKHGHGRKLRHYKHRGFDNDDRDRRWSSSRGGTYWPYAAPRYYDPPGYGSSLPPAYYAPPAYFGPPPY